MGLSSALASLAVRAPATVFVARGGDSHQIVETLRVRPDVQIVHSPRHASVLVAAGTLTDPMVPALCQIHDQLGHPRGVLLALADFPDQGSEAVFGDPVVVESLAEVADAAVELRRALLLRERASSPPLLPDVDPAPWRGVGPYGQGGKGMTGGTPYGRPFAGFADDRDGLKLDRLEVHVGPFLSLFPPGLVLNLSLQGDVVQQATIGENPFRAMSSTSISGRAGSYLRALFAPVTIRELELARAAHHLERTGSLLIAAGLSALGQRAHGLSADVEEAEASAVDDLRRVLERSRTLDWATRGVGRIPAEKIADRGLGPTARAAGVPDDLRLEQTEYLDMGFEPTLEEGGDARARWRVRLREAAASLRMAQAAGSRSTGGQGRVEAPWGRIAADHSPMPTLLELLPPLLIGAEWGDAVTTIVSLDLDLEEAARV